MSNLQSAGLAIVKAITDIGSPGTLLSATIIWLISYCLVQEILLVHEVICGLHALI